MGRRVRGGLLSGRRGLGLLKPSPLPVRKAYSLSPNNLAADLVAALLRNLAFRFWPIFESRRFLFRLVRLVGDAMTILLSNSQKSIQGRKLSKGHAQVNAMQRTILGPIQVAQ